MIKTSTLSEVSKESGISVRILAAHVRAGLLPVISMAGNPGCWIIDKGDFIIYASTLKELNKCALNKEAKTTGARASKSTSKSIQSLLRPPAKPRPVTKSLPKSRASNNVVILKGITKQ